MTTGKRFALRVLVIAVLSAAPVASAKDWDVPDSLSTLDEAFSSLADGDRILLGPGEYEIDPAVMKGIGFSLIGREGAERTTIRARSGGSPMLTIHGASKPVRIEGVRFDRTGGEAFYAVIVGSADLAVVGCEFLGGAGMEIDSSTGVIRECRLIGCYDALRVYNSPLVIENNLIEGSRQYGIVSRGSEAKIYNNTFNGSVSASVLIVGKRRYPVIGGSPGKGNTFLSHDWKIVVNDSRNEINARYNYWGAGPTSIMKELGYPANIPVISDKWEAEDRVRGYVDYRDWLEEPPGDAGVAEGAFEAGRTVSPVEVGAAAAVLIIVLAVVLGRKRRSS